MSDRSEKDRLRRIFEWDQNPASLDPYAGVHLRGRLWFAIPFSYVSLWPVLGLRTDYWLVPVAMLLAAVLGALGAAAAAIYACLPWWAVAGAGVVGCGVAMLLHGLIAQRWSRRYRSLNAAVVLAAAEKALRDVAHGGAGPGMLSGDIEAYVNDLASRVLQDPRATEDQRRRATHLIRVK